MSGAGHICGPQDPERDFGSRRPLYQRRGRIGGETGKLAAVDRDNHFAAATLKCALEAVRANVIMAVAQYGLERALGDGSLLIANYVLPEAPIWAPNEIYTPAYDPSGWRPVDYQF